MKRYLWLLFVVGTALGVGSMAIARVAPSISGGSGNGRIKSINAGSQVNVSDDGQGNVTISATPPSQGSAGDSIASATITVINADNEGSGDGYISMRINNSTKAVVAPNGRVGINTTNPSTQLDVNGVITATSIDANIAASKVQAGALNASVMVSSIANTIVTSDTIKDGTIGLTDMQSSIVLSSDTTGVTPGTYSNATVTVDRNGRVWAASVGSVSGSTYTGTFSGSGATFSTLSVTGSGSLSVTGGVATLNILGGGSGVSPLELFQDGVGRSSPTASIKIGSNLTLTLNGSSPTLSATGGSGVSDNLGNHVATMPIVSPYALTVASGTVYGQLSVGSITVVGAGAGVVHTTHSVLHVRLTDQSDNDFEVAEASVSKNVGGTMVELSTFTPNGVNTFANKTLRWQDNTIGSTRTFATWTAVAYSSLTIINRSSSKTVGMAEYSHAASSESNCAAGKAVRWPVGMISNPIASLMIRGGGTGTQRYVVGYSTVPEIVDVQFSTPTAGVNFDIPTHAGGTAEGMRTLTNVTMTAWSAIPPGTWVEPIVCRDGNAAEDGSTTNSYGFSLALDGEFDQ